MILMFEVGEGGVDALLQWHADNTHQTSDDVADRSLPASILIVRLFPFFEFKSQSVLFGVEWR